MVIATDTILAWHWTADALRDGRPIPPVGETLRHSGTLVLCDNGLHASERMLDALQFLAQHLATAADAVNQVAWGVLRR